MQYNAENQLTSVSGTPSATFVYDGDGNRVLTTVNGVTTAFIGNHTEWDVVSSSLTRYYYAGSTSYQEGVDLVLQKLWQTRAYPTLVQFSG